MPAGASRAATVALAVFCAVVSIGVCASSAGATTIRYGTATSNPTSSSAVAPSGTVVGATVVKSATFTAPKQSGGPNPTTGTCTTGAFGSTLGTSNPNALAVSSVSLNLGGCRDDGPSYDIVDITLNGPLSGTVTYQTAGEGIIALSNPMFTVRVKVAGVITSCHVVLVNPGVLYGRFRNADASAGGEPVFEYDNVALKTTTPSSTCASAIGNGAGGTGISVWNFRLGPGIVRGGPPSIGTRIGVFP